MPDEASIRKDAELVVDVCMTVEADDIVTIITDDEHSHEAHAVADQTSGTMVVDGVMLGIGLPGQVNEPITWTIEGGKAVKIEGGDDAERLREVIEGVENADVIGEFAFGVSDK